MQKVQKLFTEINIYRGFGSPENIIVADVGSLYVNMNGGTGTTLWVKETGNKRSSGWIAK
jgi:hypothetical protein